VNFVPCQLIPKRQQSHGIALACVLCVWDLAHMLRIMSYLYLKTVDTNIPSICQHNYCTLYITRDFITTTGHLNHGVSAAFHSPVWIIKSFSKVFKFLLKKKP
jgi:hypothetical protein